MDCGPTPPGARRMLRPWLSALALLALPIPGPAAGQTPADRVSEFLDAASGFQILGSVQEGSRGAGQDLMFKVTLVQGADYMVVGYCGPGCSNLDLVLLDSFGEEIEADRLPDAEPVLMFTAESTGNFEIRATMVDCSQERCSTAVGVLGSTAEPGMMPGEDMAGRLTLVGAEFTNLGFTEVGDERFGSLNSDQAIRVPIPMEAGREYRLAGVCDQDCLDLDLVLVDPSGRAVTSDRLEDAIPILAHVADTTGDFQVEVIMIACALEPCAYRVAAFAKGEKVGPGGATFSGTLLSHETFQGELGLEDDLVSGAFVEIFEVEARAGQRIIVDLRSDDFDTLLRLVGPDGSGEENDDFGYDTGHSHIEMMAEKAGVYSVQVTSFTTESTGKFTLQIAVVE